MDNFQEFNKIISTVLFGSILTCTVLPFGIKNLKKRCDEIEDFNDIKTLVVNNLPENKYSKHLKMRNIVDNITAKYCPKNIHPDDYKAIISVLTDYSSDTINFPVYKK